MRLSWLVQELEIWRGELLPDRPSTLEVIRADNAVSIVPMSLVGASVSARTDFQIWSTSESDVSGCIHLNTPVTAKPGATVSASTAPVVGLLDALRNNGHTEYRGLAMLSKGGSKRFDSRIVAGRRRD